MELIPLGVPTPILLGTVYALPARKHLVYANRDILTGNVIGDYILIFGGSPAPTMSAYKFVTPFAENLTIICKPI